MIGRVKEALIARMGQGFYEAYSQRILFAIAVQSIECWLLPLLFSDNKKAKTSNCLGTLNQGLARSKNFTIDAKRPDYYDIISSEYIKRKKLMAVYSFNPSLRVFVDDLEEAVRPTDA